MPTVDESVCCREITVVADRSDQEEASQDGCITHHPAFQSVCLDEWVLEVAYLAFQQHYEPLDYSIKKYAFMYMDTMLMMSSVNTFNIRVHLNGPCNSVL